MNINSKRLSEAEKYAEDKKWFKECIDNLEVFDGVSVGISGAWYERFKNIKINMDLYNGIINKNDFINIIAPFGEDVGELPANFNNKNIIFSKIETIRGIELQRPFNYRLIAVNPEATTRKEKAKFEKIQDYVVQSIMNELKERIYAEHEEEFAQLEQMKEMQGQGQEAQEPQVDEEGNPIEQEAPEQGLGEIEQMAQELEQRIEEEIIQQTPEEIHKYMARHHQDPAEVMFNQLLEYESKRCYLNQKLNDGCGYAAQAAIECYRIYEKNKKPALEVINPLGLTFNKSLRSDKIQDADWVSYIYFMKPNELLNEYGKDLTDDEVERIEKMTDDLNTTFNDLDSTTSLAYTYTTHGIRVQHCEWKSLKRIQFLTYMDEDEQVQQVIVDGNYKMDPEIGDIDIEEEWILATYEGTKIGHDIYVKCREVPGQHRDINNPYDCKLSYVGLVYNKGISLVERLKNYQYLYDILMYRMELQTAKDKGHMTFFNGDIVPDNLTLPEWFINLEKSGFGMFSTTKEGGKAYPFDVANAVKQVDMSLTSDIEKYQKMAEYTDIKAGESIGVTKSMEGQIQEREAVSNVQQSIAQGTTILQSFYTTHDNVKRDVMEALVKTAQDIYLRNPNQALQYVLDDLSLAVLELDEELLETSTLGFFAQDSNLDYQQLQDIRTMSHEAIAAGTLELEDVVQIYKSKSIQEADEILRVAREKKQKREDEQQQAQSQQQQEMQQLIQENTKEIMQLQHQFKMEEINAKGEIDMVLKQMELERQAVYTAGFDVEKDRNNNQVADYIEYTRKAQETNEKLKLAWEKQRLDREKFSHQKEQDKKKNELEQKKISKSKK